MHHREESYSHCATTMHHLIESTRVVILMFAIVREAGEYRTAQKFFRPWYSTEAFSAICKLKDQPPHNP